MVPILDYPITIMDIFDASFSTLALFTKALSFYVTAMVKDRGEYSWTC